MLFDNFDKKIKEAAEQHHPAYDENAWRKMENLLDQHLPKQRDRRRFFLLAFTLLFVGGGAFFLLSTPHTKNSGKIVQQNNSSTANKTQTGNTNKNNTVVQSADNSSAEITTGNTVAGIPTKIENKDNNRLDITNQRIGNTVQPRPKVSENELVLDNTLVEQEKDIAVRQPGTKSDEIHQSPASFQPGEKISLNEKPVSSSRYDRGCGGK